MANLKNIPSGRLESKAGSETKDQRVGAILINILIGVVVCLAWLVDREPSLTPYALCAAALASLSGLGTLIWVRQREKGALRDDLPSAVLDKWVLPHGMGHVPIAAVRGETFKPMTYSHVLEQYAAIERVRHVTQASYENYLSASLVAKAAASLIARESSISNSHSEFFIQPLSKKYTINIGVVKIEVDDGETKISVSDGKNVVVETPATRILGADIEDSRAPDRPLLH